jgi:hypothetical protein
VSELLEIKAEYVNAVKKEWCETHQLYTVDGVCRVVGSSRAAVEKHILSGHLPVSGRYLVGNRPRLFAVEDIVDVFGVSPSLFVSAPVEDRPHKCWVLEHSFLSRNALAALLGCCVATVERIMAAGAIVSYRRGKRPNSPLMFRLPDIEGYLSLIKNNEQWPFVSAPVEDGHCKDWVCEHSFLGCTALAALLSCSTRTIRRIMNDGDIVSYQVGRMPNSPLMFRLSDIEDYLALIKNDEG